ncbi:MAG: sugar transferase [Mycobacteriaceae bacterium]
MRAERSWRPAYIRSVAIGDALSAAFAATVGYLVRFGPDRGASPVGAAMWVAGLLPVVWVGAMLVARNYEGRYLWVGPEEFRRVVNTAFMLLATVGTVAWAFDLAVARGFVVVALPLTAVLTLVQRYGHRRWLHHRRTRGDFLQATLLVGHRGAVGALHEQLAAEAYHGYRVIGCCVPDEQRDPEGFLIDGLPVLGGMGEVAAVVARHEVGAVAVLPCPELEGPALRRLGWDLETSNAELLLAPSVTEVAGPRVGIRPVCGLPLLHMESPEFTGVRRLTKELFDFTGAVLGLVLFAPLLITLAVAVRVTSPGPVFFRQERIGQGGRPFQLLKFRSMVDHADERMEVLWDQSDGNDVQFKLRRDPRVTRVGAVARRLSLDELPQLFNVLGGSMSLVGPRPHVAREVEQYGVDMRRRLLVKPGLTGLWQVSGRSNLSWKESVRIDVRYVENWSLALDFMILWKTVGAVVRGSGAY